MLNPSNTTLAEMHKEFRRLRSAAASRGSAWDLTLEQFIEIWSPRWQDRRRLRLVLCRNGYKGPWTVENVRIDSRANQVREQHARQRELSYGGFVYDPHTRKEIDL
jgi:hypothetical protein